MSKSNIYNAVQLSGYMAEDTKRIIEYLIMMSGWSDKSSFSVEYSALRKSADGEKGLSIEISIVHNVAHELFSTTSILTITDAEKDNFVYIDDAYNLRIVTPDKIDKYHSDIEPEYLVCIWFLKGEEKQNEAR